MYVCAHTWPYTHIYIYTYIYTSGCLCASAHREERWNWSKVATIISGSDPTVLSQDAITRCYHKFYHKFYHNFDPCPSRGEVGKG